MNEDQHRTRQAEPRLGERLMEATRKLRSAIGGAARLKIYRPAQRWSQALKAISRLGPKRARGHEDTVVATRVGMKPRLLGIRSEWSIAPRANWKGLVDREPTERTAGSVARKNAVSLRTSKTPGRGRDEWPRKGRHVQPKSLIADAASMYHL